MADSRWPTVVFDLDGTLIDTIRLIVDSYQYTLESVLGRRWPDEDEIQTWIGTPLLKIFDRLAPGRAEELVEVYTTWNLDHTADYVAPYPGVKHLLESLTAAGVATGVATSKRRVAAELGISLCELTDDIALLVTAEDVPRHKPHPEPLLRAVELLEGDPATAVYVGDSAVDIQSAHRAGMDSVAVTWGAFPADKLAQENPTHQVNSVDQLAALVLGSTD